MFERYLMDNTYNFKILSQFKHKNMEYAVICEYSPSGQENIYILHQSENVLLNENEEVVYEE